jgi:hypothetical protein
MAVSHGLIDGDSDMTLGTGAPAFRSEASERTSRSPLHPSLRYTVTVADMPGRGGRVSGPPRPI